METQDAVYDMCRYYIRDEALTLGSLEPVLTGYIRGRNLKALCGCLDLFDPLSQGQEVFKVLFQVQAFFSKNASFSDNILCREAALASFFDAEAQCKDTNVRLGGAITEGPACAAHLQDRLSFMVKDIGMLLGDFDSFLESLPSRIEITSGATASASRRKSLPYLKMTMKPECTPRAEKYLRALYAFWGFEAPKCKLRDTNRIETVPKNWKTDRTIACEPAGNIPFQLAFDKYVKSRLRRKWRIDLSSQVRNQRLAIEGSRTGRFATIDLTAASDTMSINAVARLLPDQWFVYLDDIRSRGYVVDGQVGWYHKFSSMGNGATFGLETLIFAAAVRACGVEEYAVYGDDIVVPTAYFDDVVELLQFLGFTPNLKKSFSTGPFRESCGVNGFEGNDVTPFYVRSVGRSKSLTCHNINGLSKVATPWGALWNYLRSHAKGLPLVPFGADSTSGIIVDVPTAYHLGLIRDREGNKPRDGILRFKGYTSKSPTRKVVDSRAYYLWHVRKLRSSVVESSLVPLLTHKYVRKWVRWNVTVPPLGSYDHALLNAWSDFITA